MKRVLFSLAVMTILGMPAGIALAQSGEQVSGTTQPARNSARPGRFKRLGSIGNQAPHAETGETHFNASLLGNIARDQKNIWTSPARIRVQHLDWLIPAAGLTSGLLVTDRDFSSHLIISPESRKKFRNDSNYRVLGIAGVREACI
jgi:hypothetical protein